MTRVENGIDPLLLALGKNWWMLALWGILSVLLGTLLLARPSSSLSLVAALFGIYALLDGAWAILSALWVTRDWFDAWPVLFEGTVSVVVGALALTWPLFPRDLVFEIAVWGLLTGAMEIIAALRMPRRGAGHWLLATGGVCSLFLAGLILALPYALTPSLVQVIGTYAVIFGLSLWAAASSFRKTSAEEAISTS